jgi:hypothetical protein
MAVDHVLLLDPAEPDPVLDALPDPQHIDVGEFERGVDCHAGAAGMPWRLVGAGIQEPSSHTTR